MPILHGRPHRVYCGSASLKQPIYNVLVAECAKIDPLLPTASIKEAILANLEESLKCKISILASATHPSPLSLSHLSVLPILRQLYEKSKGKRVRNGDMREDATSMLWLQGVIDLLDRSNEAHHLSSQLLRAKLESIKHLDSYRDLVRLPLLSLLGRDPNHPVSVLRSLTVDS